MHEDKKYCSSSFLMYRTIANPNKCFSIKYPPNLYSPPHNRTPIKTNLELHEALKTTVEKTVKNHKAALALSGGIDSAILAKFMPAGSTAYTFKCIAPGKEVINEVSQATKYAKECKLHHKIVEIYWNDFEKYSAALMMHKGSPIHSIEVQIYKAAMQAKKDGFDTLIFGESADSVFGGLSNLLSQDYTVGNFIERYQFVPPFKVLKEPETILDPIKTHAKDGYIDPHEFISTEFFKESMGSYINAHELAQINFVAPYAECFMDTPVDYSRIRKGENKYLVRDIFSKLYPNYNIPPKTPMPRPMDEWLRNWSGPTRPEFWPHCIENMSGDQKWLIYILEQFLNLTEKQNN